MSIEISPDEVGIATRVADKLTYQHPGIVDRDDIVNALTLWMLEHEDTVRRLRERGHGLHTALFRQGQRYVQRERAQVFGYDPSDQYRYPPAQVRDLLDELVISGARDENWVPYLEVPTNESGVRQDATSSNRGDPAFGGNRLVMLIDVHAGLQSLSPPMNARLREAVAEGWDEGPLAESWGVTPSAARKRITRALQRLSDALSEIRAEHEYVGTRRAVSNARAQAALRSGAPSPTPHRHPLSRGGVLS